jgi:aldose 1-epimerase
VLELLTESQAYAYRAVESFELTPRQLEVSLSVTNFGSRRMPFGMGLHPYWTRTPDVTVRFNATHFWLEGPEYLPTDRIRVPPELDFTSARALPATWRNNDYGGWSGLAELEFPQLGWGLRMRADPVFRHLMLYCDPAQPFFCLEPQTHAVGALGRVKENERQDLGLALLEPGESLRASVYLEPYWLAESSHL